MWRTKGGDGRRRPSEEGVKVEDPEQGGEMEEKEGEVEKKEV